MQNLSFLKEFQNKFLPVADTFFQEHAVEAGNIGKIATEIMQRLKDFTLQGGKRIRPALLYYGYQCFSDKALSEVLKASLACELMQSFLLIHDDIIDEAELRRGKKTLDKRFLESAPIKKNNHYGKSMAILAGNIAGYLGMKALANLNFSKEKKYRIMDSYSQICIDEGYGEALDLAISHYDELSEKSIYKLYKYKTSRYTTEFPLICAALLAGKNNNLVKKMEEVGYALGLMFQIQDDILGVFGNDDVMGKSAASDITQGKKTLLLWKAWQAGNRRQRAYLKKFYGNPAVTPEQIAQIQNIIKETDSLRYAKTTLKNLANTLEKELSAIRLMPEGKMFILNTMQYLIERDR